MSDAHACGKPAYREQPSAKGSRAPAGWIDGLGVGVGCAAAVAWDHMSDSVRINLQKRRRVQAAAHRNGRR